MYFNGQIIWSIDNDTAFRVGDTSNETSFAWNGYPRGKHTELVDSRTGKIWMPDYYQFKGRKGLKKANRLYRAKTIMRGDVWGREEELRLVKAKLELGEHDHQWKHTNRGYIWFDDEDEDAAWTWVKCGLYGCDAIANKVFKHTGEYTKVRGLK